MREQYSVALHVAEPQVAPVGVVPLVPPLVPPLVLAAPGQSAVKVMAPAMESQLLPSRHVSCSADGLALQTCALQLDLAEAASAPHITNLASQRFAQSGAEEGVPPEVAVPEVPPDVPVGVDAVVDEQATARSEPSANVERTRAEREE